MVVSIACSKVSRGMIQNGQYFSWGEKILNKYLIYATIKVIYYNQKTLKMIGDHDTIVKIAGSKIKKFRMDLHLSLNDLAKLTGISISALNKYENADVDIKLTRLENIAKELHKELYLFLVNGEDTINIMEALNKIPSKNQKETLAALILTLSGLDDK